MQTPAQRKAKQHKKLKEQGLVQKSFWIKPSVSAKIDAYKKEHNCTDNEAIEGLLL